MHPEILDVQCWYTYVSFLPCYEDGDNNSHNTSHIAHITQNQPIGAVKTPFANYFLVYIHLLSSAIYSL